MYIILFLKQYIYLGMGLIVSRTSCSGDYLLELKMPRMDII